MILTYSENFIPIHQQLQCNVPLTVTRHSSARAEPLVATDKMSEFLNVGYSSLEHLYTQNNVRL